MMAISTLCRICCMLRIAVLARHISPSFVYRLGIQLSYVSLALVRDGVCAAWDCLLTMLASRMMLRMLVELRLALEDPLRRLGLPWGTSL